MKSWLPLLTLMLLPMAAACSSAESSDFSGPVSGAYGEQRDRTFLAQARRKLAAGDTRGARADLAKLSPEAPAAPLHLLLAEAALRDGDPYTAQEEVAAAAELDPDNAQIDMLRGMIAESTGNWVDASRAYELASSKDPSQTDSVLANVRVLHAMGDAVRAAAYLERQLAKHPRSYDLQLAAGRTYMALESWQDAVGSLSSALDLRPQEDAVRLDLVLALSLGGSHKEALDRSGDLRPEDMSATVQLALGRSALLTGDSSRAITLLSSYVHVADRDSDAQMDLARAYYLNQDLDLALASVGRVLKASPQNPAAFTLLGHVRLKSGQKELARAAYERAIYAGGDALTLTRLMEAIDRGQFDELEIGER